MSRWELPLKKLQKQAHTDKPIRFVICEKESDLAKLASTEKPFELLIVLEAYKWLG